MAKIIHYRDRCIGCGICHEQHPEMWRMSRKDGKATLINGSRKNGIYVLKVPLESANSMQAMARACPVKIIKTGP